MNEDAEKFGKTLRKLRNEKGMTASELAERIGYTQPYISMLENGRKGIPKPETLQKLAKGLEIDYYLLMFIAGHIDSKKYTNIINKKLEDKNKEIDTNIKNVFEEMNDYSEAKFLKDLYFDFFNLNMNDYNLYYKGVELTELDLKNIQKFIETFITNK